ncbi:MAG: hypothetical protein KDJ87_02895 [Rhizobiaceae bacterium]|nr:hypothetical protein [Rhizobiaceae bacterium]
MNDTRHELVKETATRRLRATPDRLECPFTVLASPGWRGIEADLLVAEAGGRTEIYKHYHPDVAFYVDAAAALDAARIAGELGVGPRVLEAWPEEGLMAMEHLGEGWRAGGLHDASPAATRHAAIAAKKTLHAGPRFAADKDIFAEIRRFAAACGPDNAAPPRHLAAWMGFVDRAEAAIAAVGRDSVPSHRDGSCANWMIGADGAFRLVDYDLSGNADPFEDIGCHLMEAHDREAEAREGFEEWTGAFREGEFQRAMVYGILDDLRWGLIATVLARMSARRSLEYAKYASWRFMRFEDHSQSSVAADRLRKLA